MLCRLLRFRKERLLHRQYPWLPATKEGLSYGRWPIFALHPIMGRLSYGRPRRERYCASTTVAMAGYKLVTRQPGGGSTPVCSNLRRESAIDPLQPMLGSTYRHNAAKAVVPAT